MEGLKTHHKKNRESTNEFILNPETGMLVSDGHEYANTSRMRAFIRRANAIRNNLPPVQKEHVRLYRGNRPDELGKNPTFTNSLEGIALPFLEAYKGELSCVEVPKADLDRYRSSTVDAVFILPTELAENATVVKEISSPD